MADQGQKPSKRAWHQTPEFLAERRKWYDKLKKSGFRDVEIHNWRDGSAWERTNGFSQMDGLKAGLHEDRGQLNSDYWYRAKQYQRCVARAHGAASLEYKAWRRYVDGEGPAAIAAKLETNVWRVEAAIKKLQKSMATWLKRELREQEREQDEAIRAELVRRGLDKLAGDGDE